MTTTTISTTVDTDLNNNSVYSYTREPASNSSSRSPGSGEQSSSVSSGGAPGPAGSSTTSPTTSKGGLTDSNNNNKCCANKISATSRTGTTTTTTMLNLIVNKCSKLSKDSSSPSSAASTTSSTASASASSWFNVSNSWSKLRSNSPRRPSPATAASATISLFHCFSAPTILIQTSFLVILLLFAHTVSADSQQSSNNNALTNSNSNANSIVTQIPDQIAMAAEHRIGHGGGGGAGGAGAYGVGGVGPGGGGGGGGGGGANFVDDNWPLQSSHDMPQIKILQVQCEKSHMRVNIEFDRPFYGMIFSKGYYSDPHCVHLAPGSGHLSATFDIYLDACGMSSSANGNSVYGPAPSGTFVENTIIIQYDPLVQEVWDQARKLRCTWYDFYEKSVTFRPFQVDMLHAVTANFLGDNLQCWMQIQVGKGPWASEVSGIVKIGQTMTMVLAIKDDENKFDMLVRNCVAHDGKRAPIQLVDAYGCVTRPKIMSRFHKIKNFGPSASVVSYAYFQAFKFPDSMNVHFQCVIQVCRFQCPEPKCGGEEVYGPPGLAGPGNPDPRHPHGAYSENKEALSASPSSSLPEPLAQNSEQISNSIIPHLPPHQQPQHVLLQQQHHHQQQPMRGPPQRPQFPHPHPHQQQQLLPHHLQHPFNKAIPVPMPLPGSPSTVMLPPMPMPGSPPYSSVKREGVILDDQQQHQHQHAGQDELLMDGMDDEQEVGDEEEEEDEVREPSFAALGGRPRSVDFDKKEMQRQMTKRSADGDEEEEDHHFVVHVSHVYKREAQEMTDMETTRVIQVVAPGDVAFNLNGGSRSRSSSSSSSNNNSGGGGEDDEESPDSIIIESSLRGAEIDGICMSVSSFVGGLVMLLLLLVVSSLVAAFLFVRVRSIHRKTAAVYGGGGGSTACISMSNSSCIGGGEYLKSGSS